MAKNFQGLGPKRWESCNGDRVYIYIYIEREREIDIYIYIYIYMFSLYLCICFFIYVITSISCTSFIAVDNNTHIGIVLSHIGIRRYCIHINEYV